MPPSPPSPSSSSWAGGWKQNFDNVEFFLFFIFIFHRKWPRYLSKNEENLTYCSEVQCQVLVLECFWINIVPQLSIVCQTGENFWKCHSSLLFAGFNQKTKPIYVSLWLFFFAGDEVDSLVDQSEPGLHSAEQYKEIFRMLGWAVQLFCRRLRKRAKLCPSDFFMIFIFPIFSYLATV